MLGSSTGIASKALAVSREKAGIEVMMAVVLVFIPVLAGSRPPVANYREAFSLRPMLWTPPGSCEPVARRSPRHPRAGAHERPRHGDGPRQTYAREPSGDLSQLTLPSARGARAAGGASQFGDLGRSAVGGLGGSGLIGPG